MEDLARLPAAVTSLLDGSHLEAKARQGLQLSAADQDGWIRQAMLSVGELLAVSDREIAVALYADSRTTGAVAATCRGLLTIVCDGRVLRLHLTFSALEPASIQGMPHQLFLAQLAAVDEDHVGYAQVTHGIEFEAHDPEIMLEGWQTKLSCMRKAVA